MKILVTGGAGFIGSCYLRKYVLLNKNNDYICLDALTYAGSLDNIKDIMNENNFKFILGNICDKDLVDKIFKEENFDYVINFAAETHVDNSINNPNIFIQTNVLGTNVLLDASVKYNIKRFHQVSTDEVYGQLSLDELNIKFKESDILNPSSPYSASKASADLLVLSYHKTFNLDVTISRCSNNYGPYQHTEKLIPKTISNLLNDKKIGIYGNGLNVRDWIYVEDHIDGIELILHKGITGEIYNIGGNFEINNVSLVKMISSELNKKDMIEFIEDRLGHDLRYALDTKKIENIGFVIKYNFEKGIKETIKYYKNSNESSD